MRIKRGKTVRRVHKRIKAATTGFRTLRRTSIKRAREALVHSLSYAYRDRRNRKRDFRALWINRINAGLVALGIGYSRFIKTMHDKQVMLDRKVLAQLAAQHPEVFERTVTQIAK